MRTASTERFAGLEKLQAYFGIPSNPIGPTPIGMEVETSFVDDEGKPITLKQSQQIFRGLVENGWAVVQTKGALISAITDARGNKLLYDVGRQNLEIATIPARYSMAVSQCRNLLDEVYAVAAIRGASPLFQPIIHTAEDLLVIPDERDMIWVELDGREALKKIAMMSAVQFTVEVPAEKAIQCLNRLGRAISAFLEDYPQDAIWRDYIKTSKAGYREDRYGGPINFRNLEHYCREIAKHDVVLGPKLVPFEQAADFDITLHLRSVWWYFRLRRYGERLCIEVRPLSRRSDSHLDKQLDFVLDLLGL